MAIRPWRKNLSLSYMLCFLLAVAMGLLSCGKKEAPETVKDDVKLVKLMTVEASLGSGRREFPGNTQATQIADLAFRIGGPLVELPVAEGEYVEQGELLAKIDPRDYETIVNQVSASLQAARAQLQAMEAGARPEDMARLQADVSAREATLDEVKTRYDRYRKLYEEEVISKQQLDSVRAEYNVAVQSLESSKQQLSKGQTGARVEDIAAQQATIRGLESQRKEAQDALADTELRAPFSGIVARTYVENHEFVQAKQNILSFQDPQRIEIAIDVPENELARAGESVANVRSVIGTLMHISATFPAYPGREFPVELKSFETEADPKTQTFRVTFVMDQPGDPPIIPGMNAVINAKRSTDSGELVTEFHVPVKAVFADSAGNKNVWVVDPATQQVQRRQIVADEMSGDNIRVADGLQAGEVIAVSAVRALREGMKVKQMPDLEKL
ncbi:MAG: efflux RND transporter periplasmic adaptor subunit [bacterium]|nr:efflux RND transporter periplasmic adaptor subunit [bacterium]